eukprot:883202-Ditylum_brightwellii.AAC.1
MDYHWKWIHWLRVVAAAIVAAVAIYRKKETQKKSSGNQDSAHSCTTDEMDVVLLNTVSSFSKLSISKSIEEWMNCSQDEDLASFFNIDEEHSPQTCIKTQQLMAILVPYLIILFK